MYLFVKPWMILLHDPYSSDVRFERKAVFLVVLIDMLDLQALQLWTDRFVAAITQSTKKMPFSMRYLARETLTFVRVSEFLLSQGSSANIATGKIP